MVAPPFPQTVLKKKGRSTQKSSPLSCRLLFGTPSLRWNEHIKVRSLYPPDYQTKNPFAGCQAFAQLSHEEIQHERMSCDPFGYPQFAINIRRAQRASGTVWITMHYDCLVCGLPGMDYEALRAHVTAEAYSDKKHEKLRQRLLHKSAVNYA